MGFFRKPDVDRAPAAAEVRFLADGSAAVTWHGAPELLVRAPAIYLDWAVNKDQRRRALSFLAEVRRFLDEERPDRVATPEETPSARAHTADGAGVAQTEVTVAFTDAMLCKPSFRPRMGIGQFMYPTFWALWNEMALRVGADEPETVEALVDDLNTQLDYYDRHGVGVMRGGLAHVQAGQIGAGRRYEQQIAEEVSLTAEEFRSLPESERDALVDEHTTRNLKALQQQGASVTVDADQDVDEVFVSASQHFFNDAFDKTSSKWDDLYEPALLSTDADFALQLMTSRVAETPSDGAPIEDYDHRLSGILSTGLGGYVWRAAEQAVGRTIGSEIVDGVREAIALFESGESFEQVNATTRQAVLYQASARCIELHVPLWYTSPGYRGWGHDLFRAGEDFVTDRVVKTEGISPGDLYYAFAFGVALRHVENQLGEPGCPQPGEWTGPDWERCEIVLREAGAGLRRRGRNCHRTL